MNYIKLVLLIFCCSSLSAQVQVLVTDGSTNLPLVDIYDEANGITYQTDVDGYFLLAESIDDKISLTFSYTGYEQVSHTAAWLRENPTVTLQTGISLEEIVVIGRTDERTQEIINQLESVKAADIQLTSPQTAADALGQHAGVFIQKSQMGGGSPVIRGFEANKVLLVVDGVRMNNAIYRSGHLQNAITVDAAILERMEVVYGPGSLVYGSDALGGVVHFRSQNPQLRLDGTNVDGAAYIRYSSASQERSAHAHVNIGNDKWASLTSITASDFGDLRTGRRRSDRYPNFGTRPYYVSTIDGVDEIVQNDNPNLQVGTGYQQLDIVQKVLYQATDHVRFVANVQHSTSSDVPRYDALTEEMGGQPRFAEWYYGPQQRSLVSLRGDMSNPTSMYDKLIVIAAYQNIDEDRIDRRFGSNIQDRMNEDVGVYSMTADLQKELTTGWNLHYGAEASYNSVSSTASRTDILTGMTEPAAITRYPSGGSSTSSLAAYLYSKRKWKQMDLLLGMRYTHNQVRVAYSTTDAVVWPQEFYEGLSSTNDAVSWSVGGLYRLTKGWRLKGQVATAFRAPNVDDLAKIRINNDEVSVPNLDLQPESSLTTEVTVDKTLGSSTVSATVFHTQVRDIIIRDAFSLPDGTPYLVDEGDTLQTVANVNADRGRIWGISVNATAKLSDKASILASTSYTKGTSFDSEDVSSPLAHIPPLYGHVTLSYQWSKVHQTRAVWRYNSTKPVDEYGGSADNIENATVDGTPAWQTWNIYHRAQLTSSLRVSLSLENILDVHYRPFSSGVSAPGRNIQVTLGLSF